MIRSLHRGLGIPAASLLGDRDPSVIEEQDIPWDRFPLREMFARGWIRPPRAFGKARISAEGAEDILSSFFAPLGGPSALAALYRKGEHVRSARTMDPYALTAWTARVLLVAAESEFVHPFEREAFTAERLRQLVQLSEASDGPIRAIAFLREMGIPVVVEPHLPRTQLDGAAIRAASGRPVIGLTLRYDRLDNFWFTLMHEIVHVLRHLAGANIATPSDARTVERFYDDLDVELDANPAEREADFLAGEWLVPSEAWESSAARYVKSPEAVGLLANELDVHPAIVAGKVRHFFKEYRVLNNLVGHGEVRRLFPSLQWGT
jgi:HTH-type transcriptional regulator/antitoxin HigA